MKSNSLVGLETLLDLHGEIFPMDNGYWVKFEAYEVAKSKEIPHGIKYSITLHNRQNIRVLGFDNAHGVKVKKYRYAAKKITWDHKHLRNKVVDYEFESPAQLIEDFWVEAGILMEEI